MSQSFFSPSFRNPLAVAAAALVLLGASNLDAKGCFESATQSLQPPEQLWGGLWKPTKVLVDTTRYTGNQRADGRYPMITSVDVENGWVFASYWAGLQVWDARAPNEASPTQTAQTDGYLGDFIEWAKNGEVDQWIYAVDAPAGKDDVAMLGGYDNAGISIWDLSNKNKPQIKYQNSYLSSMSVYSATIGGVDYGFAGVWQGGVGVFPYNMTAAKGLANPCLQDSLTPGCGSIRLPAFNTTWAAKYVHGLAFGGKNFVAVGRGFPINPGPTEEIAAIWDVSNPAAPTRVGVVTTTSGELGAGVAMWSDGGQAYLALRTRANARIYNVTSCLSGVGCGTLPSPIADVPLAPVIESDYYKPVTFSRSGSTPVLFYGHGDLCHDGEDGAHTEYLFDVSDPFNPIEISSTATMFDQGKTVDYWSWFYSDFTRGFSSETPRGGKFVGRYLYRAALTIFDVHEWLGGSQAAPIVGSVSASPNPALVCQPVSFTANDVTGYPVPTLSWVIKNSGGTEVASGSGESTFRWPESGPPPNPSDTYFGFVSATNTLGKDTKSSPAVSFTPPPPLPPAQGFAPTCTNCTNGSPQYGTVQLDVAAAGATEWCWDFGDGTSFPNGCLVSPLLWSNDPVGGKQPSHSYQTLGTYQVTVNVRNCIEGARQSSALAVTINSVQPLEAHFQAQCSVAPCTYSYSVGSPVTFVDSSLGAQIWEYDWNGDGTFEDNNGGGGYGAPVLTHTYAAAGTFTPKLKVHRGTEENVVTHVQALTISSGTGGGGGGGGGGGTAITVSGPTSGAPGTAYTFNASATGCTPNPTAWTWTLGGGGTGSSTINSVAATWTTTGTKTVSAKNTACGTTTGQKSISIGATGGGGGGGGGGGLVANFSLAPEAPKAGEAVNFEGASSSGSPTAYTWSWGDGTADASGAETSAKHTFAAAGTYKVVLTVSKPGNCPPLGLVCSALSEKFVAVVPNGPPPPVASYSVVGGASCVDQFGLAVCQAQTGAEVALTSTSTGTVDSLAWDFGDGQTAAGSSVTHRFTKPGDLTVKLTAFGNGGSSQASKSFIVSGPAASESALVLSWFQRSHGALEQTSDFFAYNPGEGPLTLKVVYQKRGTPNPNPPTKTLVVAPRATRFVADALKSLFGLDEGSGFLYFTWEGVATEPVITGTNNTKLADGTTFGQSFAAVKMPRTFNSAAATAVPDQNLVGLADVSNEGFSTFGVSNPFDGPANIQLEFTNGAGAPLRPALPVTIARNSQVLYQIVDIRALGVQNQDNYRLTVKTVSGGPVIPFAKKLRSGSQDQAYVPAIKTQQAKVLLLGAYSGDTVRGNKWSTDAVLFNPTAGEMVVEARFIPVGVNATPSALATFRLQPKESRRFADILKTEWNAQGINGYISFETKNAGSGPYAGILGEIYDYSNPLKVYGNVFGALSDDDAGVGGQSLALIGLSQNAAYATTLWLYNPGPGPAQAEIIYRASSDGRELARTLTGSPEGVMRLINPKNFPAAVQNLNDSFTVEVHINFGRMMASALMVSNATKDPTYVVGVAH